MPIIFPVDVCMFILPRGTKLEYFTTLIYCLVTSCKDYKIKMSCDDKLIPRTVYLLKRTDKKHDGTDLYVGSTSSWSLPKRLSVHRHQSKISDSKLYRRMSEVGLQNWEIVPLVIIPKCTRTEILNVEKLWLGFLNPDLNTFSPIDVDNKWNSAHRRDYNRQYYLNSIKGKKIFL